LLITGRTKVAGILGAPEQVALSLSPAIHNAAFRALDMDWVYVSFGTLPEELPLAIQGLAAAGVRGMNVTMPHKVAAMEFMDHLTPQARTIGALNTIEVVDGELIGHNTDGEGLVRFIKQDLGVDVSGCKAVVLGSGGSARAAVSGLATAEVGEICVLARSVAMAELLRPVAGNVAFTTAPIDDDPGQWVSSANLIVHATPVGQKMEEPLIPAGSISRSAVVVDLVYKPPVTPLIEAARARGAIAHSGLGMLLHQAALAFEIWTGVQPPIEAMSAAALLELAHFDK
jgi:shikimate dehydrogenase